MMVMFKSWMWYTDSKRCETYSRFR